MQTRLGLLKKFIETAKYTKKDFDRCGGRPEVPSGLREVLGVSTSAEVDLRL